MFQVGSCSASSSFDLPPYFSSANPKSQRSKFHLKVNTFISISFLNLFYLCLFWVMFTSECKSTSIIKVTQHRVTDKLSSLRSIQWYFLLQIKAKTSNWMQKRHLELIIISRSVYFENSWMLSSTTFTCDKKIPLSLLCPPTSQVLKFKLLGCTAIVYSLFFDD